MITIVASLLLGCIDSLLPSLTYLINNSLQSATLPSEFNTLGGKKEKKTLQKKHILDPKQFRNNRHVLNLPCLSKAAETSYSTTNRTCEQQHPHTHLSVRLSFGHSMETARLRVFRDLLLSADFDNASVLTLLDLSAVFDAIDRHIALDRVQNYFGISGPAIDWFQSCLSDRQQN